MKRPIALLCRSLVLLLAGLAPFCIAAQDQRRQLPRPLLLVFRELIKEPVKSTVQIYCDDARAALGAVVRSDGHIVTKASELKENGKIECQLANEKQKREAKVVARDSATDLAILKIDAKNLPVAPWSTDEPPAVGSWLATTGLSQDPLSFGVVSVAARKILPPQAALGIQLDEDEKLARIAGVAPGLAAERAKLKEGDIVRKVNGEAIKGRPHLQQVIRSHQPGDKVTLVIEREGKVQTIEATLGSMSDLVPRDERSEFQNSLGGALSERRSGFPLAIQHDSVLRPIDCGGPIVDLDGKVVGLNIARAGRVESYALPSSVVRETVDRLLKTELISTPAEDKLPGRKNGPGQER
jgi:serine protease Do